MVRQLTVIAVALALLLMGVPLTVAELVLYLPFEGSNPQVVEDASGRGNDGEIFNAVNRVEGNEDNGQAIEIASGGYVDIPEIPEYDVTSAMSVCAWVQTTTVDTWARVVDKSQWQTSGFDLALSMVTHAPLFEFFVANTTSQALATTPVDDGQWHFLAGTFGDKTVRIYVDGVMEHEVPSTNEHDINPNDFPIRLGREANPSMGQQYVGNLDEVAFFDHTLTADEVQAIFENGINGGAPVDAHDKLSTVWATLKRNP